MKDTTRILFVGSGLDIGGGAERQWSLLIPGFRDRGYGTSVLTLVEEGPHFQDLLRSGIPANCVGMRHRTDFVRFARALRYARIRPHLVVSQSINANVVAHLIARRVDAPHIVTEHTGPGPGSPRAAHREFLTRLLAPRVDAVIAVSRAQIPGLLKVGYREDRIHVIPNAVPEVTIAKTPASVRAELGIRRDDFLALLAASLRPEKSADVFVRAVQRAHRIEPRVRGLLAGRGQEFDRLARLAGDDGFVRLLGERSDVPELLNAADVACLSSTAEASPIVLLEAMSVGKPVIATNVGGVPETVIDEETGLLVAVGDSEALADAILRLAYDPALGERLGGAGRQRQRSLFSVDRMIADYAVIFETFLADRAVSQRGPVSSARAT